MTLAYIIISLLFILVLTVKQKDYWKEKFEVVLHLKLEITICLVCFALAYTSIELQKKKSKEHNKFEVGSLDQTKIEQINFIDRGLAGRWDIVAKGHAKIFKNVAIYIIPLSLLFFIGTIKTRLVLFFVFSQGYILTESLTGLAKGLVDRYRPFAYRSIADVENLSVKAKEKFLEDIVDHDILNSFFSGDASITTFGFIFFALSHSLFYKQSKFRSVIWVIAIISVILECYFRALSGKHFPIDVLIGGLVGSAIAYGIIRIHNNSSTSIELE